MLQREIKKRYDVRATVVGDPGTAVTIDSKATLKRRVDGHPFGADLCTPFTSFRLDRLEMHSYDK